MPVSKRLRFEILRRDKHACRYCGGVAPDVKLQVDHVIPETLGGSGDPDNLVAACIDCNAGKSSVPADAAIVADVSAKALEWGKAMQAVIQERAAAAADRQELWGWFNMIWCGWAEDAGLINDRYPDGPEVPHDWIDTIAQFLAAGLTHAELRRFAQISMFSKVRPEGKWKYFCGCCWTEIRHMQDRAMEILATNTGGE